MNIQTDHMNEKKNILLVEDDKVVAGAGRRILNAEGFTVDMAESAEDALGKFSQKKYELVLSDLMLPGMTGIELLKKLKKLNEEIHIIIITGYASLTNAVKTFKAGAFDFIPKPFDFEELAGVVYRAVQFNGMTQNMIQTDNKNIKKRQNINGEELYSLGQHSWAKIDEDGSIIVGVGSTFARCVGNINSVELPLINNEISQGNLCVRIISQDYLNHMVWAPLSGKVIGLNNRVESEVDLINTDPFGDGWLIKIIPTNLERELENLTAHHY